MSWSPNLVLSLFSWWCVMQQVPAHSPWILWLVGRRMQHFKNAGIPSMRRLASREIIHIPLNCASLFLTHPQLVGTNLRLPNMHKLRLRSILSLQDPVQSQSPETVPTCIVVQCFPHDHTAWIHLWDECKKSNEPSVCHMLSSTSWWHEQACLQTIECLVFQCVPNTGISGQFESIFLTNLQQIPILLLWIDGHQDMEL